MLSSAIPLFVRTGGPNLIVVMGEGEMLTFDSSGYARSLGQKSSFSRTRNVLAAAAIAAVNALLAAPQSNAAIISIESGSPVDFGRIKVGSTPSRTVVLNKSPTGVTSWTATASNSGISVTPTSGTTSNGNNQKINLTISAVNNANGSGTTGLKNTYTVTVDNTTDNSDPNDVIPTTMTVLNDRDLSQSGGAIDLGNVFVNVNTATLSATITGGSATDNEATRVTLGTGNVTQNSVTVGGGSSFTFNAANQTTTRNIFGNFSTSGAKSGNVNIASQLSNADTLATGGGTIVLDSTINVAFTATAWDMASLTANTASTLGHGSNVSIVNAAGAFRSAGFVDSISLSAGWSLNNLSVGNAVTSSGTPTANVAFNSAGLLNGYTAGGNLTIEMENNQAITGATNQDGPTLAWNLSQTVSGNVGDGTAAVASNAAYDGLSGTSDEELGSVATLRDGDNANGGATTVSMSWRERNANEEFPTGTTPPLPGGALGLVSDVVDLTGTAGDVFVLQLSYDPAMLVLEDLTESQLAALGYIYLVTLDAGQWKLSTETNTGANTTNPALLNYQGSWDSSGAGLTLGAYGVDTDNDVVWAVLDHNSEFAVVPEPASIGLLLVAGAATLRRRPRLRG